MHLSDCLADFHHTRNHNVRTRERYRACVRALRFYLRRPPDLSDLTAATLAGFVGHRRNLGRSPNTVRGELSKLLALARWLAPRHGFEEPELQAPRRVLRAPLAWSRRELRRLFREAYRTRRMIYGLPGCIYWPALLNLAWDTGERVGALLQLEWSDFEGRHVVFAAELRKGHYADAVCKLSRQTVRSLEKLKRYGRERPFDLGCKSTLYKAYKRLLRDAGLPSDYRSMFHRLRRSHATHLYLAGGDATLSLHHTSEAMTRQHYIDARLINQSPVRLLFRPFSRWF